MNWLEQEESLIALRHQQVRRLLARSRCRPVATACLAAVIGLVIFAAQARRPKLYEAEVGLLITEGAFETDGRPRPPGELRAFIADVAFADARLDNLIAKRDLVQRLGASDRAAALARMRKLINVRTWHDYFEGYRQRADPPRTARVTIGFSAPDPALALAVARDLGELVAETQTARETQRAMAQIDGLRSAVDSAASESARQRDLLEQAERAAGELPDLGSLLRVKQLARGLESAEKASRSVAAQLLEAQLHLRTVQQIGTRVQVVDPGIPPWHTPAKSERLVQQAVLALILSLPLAVILVGAFDPTIRDEQDLRRAGLRLLGRVPSDQRRLPRVIV
jgi:hypothetical protein